MTIVGLFESKDRNMSSLCCLMAPLNPFIPHSSTQRVTNLVEPDRLHLSILCGKN